MLKLNSPIEELRGVGPKILAALRRLGIRTSGDLLKYYPFRYDDFSRTVAIADLKPGQTATVKGQLEQIESRRSFRRRLVITEAALTDGTGYLKLVWFNQPFISRMLKAGDRVMVSGQADWQYGAFQMVSPAYELVKAEQTHVGRIVPVYSVTEGLTPKYVRALIRQVIPLTEGLADPLPETVRSSEQLMPLGQAFRSIHFPKNQVELEAARQRLAFNEVLRVQLQGLKTKALLKSSSAPVIQFKLKETQRFVKHLPFKLTAAQRRAAWAIIKDLGQGQPMNRLLQGDVGSGKTVVAVMAVLNAVWSKCQIAYMAPTEILAEQHFNTLNRLLPSNVSLGLLTGALSKTNTNQPTSKKRLKEYLASGKISVVIGTHALIEEDVRFARLGLVIIDEQHRFGVDQRQILRSKGFKDGRLMPHFLTMTATPIPRTLALTLYGDLDISTINELPPGRVPTKTSIVPSSERDQTYAFIRGQIKSGHQAFVITPLIEESDKLGVKAAAKAYRELTETIFPDLRIGLLHGRLASNTKERVMREFAQGQLNILVSTAVVEVGVDVPNATVMLIEGAERFGLSQLHQFRGRVGRSTTQSYCFIFSDEPEAAQNPRLKAFTETTDGFALAEADLKLRGPGELRGGRQSGLPDFQMASLHDIELIKRAREAAKRLLEEDPKLDKAPLLKRIVESDREIHWE